MTRNSIRTESFIIFSPRAVARSCPIPYGCSTLHGPVGHCVPRHASREKWLETIFTLCHVRATRAMASEIFFLQR